MKRTTLLLAAAAAAAIGLALARALPPSDDAAQAGVAAAKGAPGETKAETASADAAAPLVETIVSTATPYRAAVRLRGVAEAARRVTVSAQTSGLVISEPLRKGAEIAQGDLLCEIEPAERAARLAEAKARLAEAEAVAQASAELGKKGFSAETTRARDRAALEAAKTAVAAAALDLQRTRMTAPFAGRLETDTAEIGSLLALGAPCALLLDLDPIRFVGHASEAEVADLSAGLPVEAALLDGRRVEATVTFVARSADSSTRTFRVEATAANPEDRDGGPVRDGATATLEIFHGTEPAHLVPRSALMLDDAGRLGVMTAAAGVARFEPVEILADGAEGAWISGPPATAEIVLTGQYFLSDGAPLRSAPRPTTEAGR